MKVGSLLLVIAMLSAAIKLLFRIIDLIFPSLFKGTKLQNWVTPSNFETGIAYFALLCCLIYAIYNRINNIIP